MIVRQNSLPEIFLPAREAGRANAHSLPAREAGRAHVLGIDG